MHTLARMYYLSPPPPTPRFFKVCCLVRWFYARRDRVPLILAQGNTLANNMRLLEFRGQQSIHHMSKTHL